VLRQVVHCEHVRTLCCQWPPFVVGVTIVLSGHCSGHWQKDSLRLSVSCIYIPRSVFSICTESKVTILSDFISTGYGPLITTGDPGDYLKKPSYQILSLADPSTSLPTRTYIVFLTLCQTITLFPPICPLHLLPCLPPIPYHYELQGTQAQ
jgi:hypothetical protein